MANGGIGMSGVNYDAFVSSQRTFSDHDLAAKIQEKYWQARQKFLSKIEKKEDSCIVLSDSKLDAKLEIYRSIDKSCAKLTDILESYQNCLYVLANEENALGVFLRECSKVDKTRAGKVMAIAGKSLTQSSHQRIRLYMPLVRLYQEMETFHSRAVEDTADTVDKLESKRTKYRASLLWMKDISEKLDPDVYRELDKFRRVQNQVRIDKKAFDCMQMDVVQKIDLLMASRCNLINQVLAPYQANLLETFEKNRKTFECAECLIKKEDIHEYEFKTLRQLNPLQISEENDDNNNNNNNNHPHETQTASTTDENLLGVDRELPSVPVENLLGAEGQPPSSPVENLLGEEGNDQERSPSTIPLEDLLGDLMESSPADGNDPKGISQKAIDDLMGTTCESNADDDLLGDDFMLDQLTEEVPKKSNQSNVDLLTNELDEIDNSSYFKSLQSQVQL